METSPKKVEGKKKRKNGSHWKECMRSCVLLIDRKHQGSSLSSPTVIPGAYKAPGLPGHRGDVVVDLKTLVLSNQRASGRMSRLKCGSFALIVVVMLVNSIVGVPTPSVNATSDKPEARSRPKFVEIQLPVKLTSMDELFTWVKTAMQNMASKIDVTLAGNRSEGKKGVKRVDKVNDKTTRVHEKPTKGDDKTRTGGGEPSASPRIANVGYDSVSSWSKTGNEIIAPLLHAGAFLPLFFGEGYADKFRAGEYEKYAYDVGVATPGEKTVKFKPRGVDSQGSTTGGGRNTSGTAEPSPEAAATGRVVNGGGNHRQGVPFSIPFEAVITITREHEVGTKGLENGTVSGASSNVLSGGAVTPVPQQSRDCNHSAPSIYFQPRPQELGGAEDLRGEGPEVYPGGDRRPGGRERVEVPKRNSNSRNKDNSRRRLVTLGDLLKSIGLIRKSNKSSKLQEAATVTSTARRPPKKSRDDPFRRPAFHFEDELPQRPTRNESSQRQEFDDSDEEAGGSLGSVAELVPLALPILEGLSDPESEDDLIEVIQAAVPILQGLSEGDDDEGGGVNDLIAMIVPVIIRIINGKDGQGIDLAALFGPIFSLLAPFIGPVLAPIIGPLIRTISNPPTEGSSLGALITAIAGPLSAPQEPSGMSPLSIVIAGTTAALLRELKLGAPGGSDVGALVGSILSGVLAGTSAGLSGGSSGGTESASPAPYGAPVSASTINVGFPGRPSPGPPLNQFSNQPSHAEGTVHIGSTVRPSYTTIRPTYPYPHYQATVATPTRLPSPRPLVQHHSGPVTAATGQDSYLPTGTAVPASSVNPLALLGNSVKDILGAGIQVVTSLINAVFGIIGASSADPPAPTYGAPSGYGHASG
ncbi:uncharacterized protein LOC135167416 [Diachasmimorpha longicaudata]|uniref:uncharacterized protein LOC135167416 n=1 Tax=Diachasmimorpha longicaudata TaxID=58733 RepID=UPI0030B8CBBD